MTDPSLALIHHDPPGRLLPQVRRAWPTLQAVFSGVAVVGSAQSHAPTLDFIAAAGACVQRETARSGAEGIGRSRRSAVALALRLPAPTIFYCDLDRILHWAECHPAELAATAARLAEHDFTVLGRTPRALASHPRCQRDTECLVNHVFALAAGRDWDVTSAARGLGRRAAEALVAGCRDDAISTDVSWPLWLLRQGGFTLGYLAVEGLEFETADRYPDEVTAAGGLTAWIDRLDADPRQWATRLRLAEMEVEAVANLMKGQAGF